MSSHSAHVPGSKIKKLTDAPRGEGGGTPLYKLYRYVPPQRAWFLSHFGLKTGIDCDHHGLKSGAFYQFFSSALMRSLITLQIQRQLSEAGLKTGVENGMSWSEIGSGFGEPGGTPLQIIPRSIPPPPPRD